MYYTRVHDELRRDLRRSGLLEVVQDVVNVQILLYLDLHEAKDIARKTIQNGKKVLGSFSKPRIANLQNFDLPGDLSHVLLELSQFLDVLWLLLQLYVYRLEGVQHLGAAVRQSA